jgi:hypothetical protein
MADQQRPRATIESEIAALAVGDPTDPQVGQFRLAAGRALRWVLAGGPGPLTARSAPAGQYGEPGQPSPRELVAELAKADAIIYGRSSRPRDVQRARGVQHALMWARYATATPPSRWWPSPEG